MEEGPPRFAFQDAEAAASDALGEVIDKAAVELYDLYLDRSSYPFACEVATDIVRARMSMAFVPFDPGELSDEGWLPEPLPERPPLDAWARSCVPVVRRAAGPEASDAGGKRRTVAPAAGSFKPPPGSAEPEKREIEVKAQWSIAEDFSATLDQEEQNMRDVKLREENKKKADARRAQRMEEETKARDKQAKARAGDMEQKQFAFDSEGNVIWVQPVAAEKLPAPIQLPSYKLRAEPLASPAPSAAPSRELPRPTRKGRKKEPVFTDLFTRLANEQPACIDVIELTPGVQCSEKGKNRSNVPSEPPGYTRKAYEEFVNGGADVPAPVASKAPGAASKAPAAAVAKVDDSPVVTMAAAPEPPSPRKVPPPPADIRAARAPLPSLDEFNQSLVDNKQWGDNPPSPSNIQAQARTPNAAHSWKLKRDAVGHLGKVPRERLAGLGGTVRYRLPPPPLGAVMGHGLLGDGVDGEFYYPGGSPGGSPEGKRAPPPPTYDAATIGHALNLNAQRADGGGVITTRKAELVKTILH